MNSKNICLEIENAEINFERNANFEANRNNNRN